MKSTKREHREALAEPTPVTEAPPVYQPSYAPEDGVFPSVGIARFISLLVENWKENPICRYLWRRVRPYALALALFSTAFYASNAMVQLSQLGGSTTSTAVLATLMGIMYLLMLANVVVVVAAPIVYTLWAFKKTYLQDEPLRAAPLSSMDRLFGILVPGILGVIVFYIPSVFIAPIMTIQGFEVMTSTLGGESLPLWATIFCVACAMLTRGVMAFLYITLFTTIVVRTLSLDKQTGMAYKRSWGKIVLVYGAYILLFIALSCVMSLPMFLILIIGIAASGGNFTPGSVSATGPYLITQGLSVLAYGVGCIIFFYIARLFWTNDTLYVLHYTFTPPEDA
ncbi:hypothetical protein KQI84_16770 [bacterium]|nr:hypothetical protein [bacterium]